MIFFYGGDLFILSYMYLYVIYMCIVCEYNFLFLYFLNSNIFIIFVFFNVFKSCLVFWFLLGGFFLEKLLKDVN